jgi:hypothetical protein
MSENQFSLRAIFIATAAIAFFVGMVTEQRIVVVAVRAVPFAVCGACLGVAGGYIFGTNKRDMALGAIFGTLTGAVAGALIWATHPTPRL